MRLPTFLFEEMNYPDKKAVIIHWLIKSNGWPRGAIWYFDSSTVWKWNKKKKIVVELNLSGSHLIKYYIQSHTDTQLRIFCLLCSTNWCRWAKLTCFYFVHLPFDCMHGHDLVSLHAERLSSDVVRKYTKQSSIEVSTHRVFVVVRCPRHIFLFSADNDHWV